MKGSIFDIDELILFILKKMIDIEKEISDIQVNKNNIFSKKIMIFNDLLKSLLYIKDKSIFCKRELPEFFYLLYMVDNSYSFSDLDIVKLHKNYINMKLADELICSDKAEEEFTIIIFLLQMKYLRQLNLKKLFDKFIQEKTSDENDERVKNEKKTFKKKIFDLEEKISYFEGYSSHLKRSAIKELLLDIINIKDEANKTDFCLYQVNRKRKGKIKTYELYDDIKKKADGLNTSVLCDQILAAVSETDYPLETVDEENYIFHNICVLVINLIENKDLVLIGKTFLKIKKEFLKETELLTEKPKKQCSEFGIKYTPFEKLKNKCYLMLEIFSLLYPQNIKELINQIEKNKNYIIEFNLKNKKAIEENNNKISLNMRNYIKEYNSNKELQEVLFIIKEQLKNKILKQNSKIVKDSKNNKNYKENKKLLKDLEKIGNEKYEDFIYRIKIDDLEKIPDEKLFSFIKCYIHLFFTKHDSEFTIKDELVRNIIVYFRINDYISELKTYIKILNDLKKKSDEELERKLKKYKTLYEKNDIQESVLGESIDNLVYVESQSYIKSNEIYSKSKIKDYIKRDSQKQDKKYVKEWKNNKIIWYIKYINLKLYFDNIKEEYFNEFCILLKKYVELLENILYTTHIYDKSNIDTALFNILTGILSEKFMKSKRLLHK